MSIQNRTEFAEKFGVRILFAAVLALALACSTLGAFEAYGDSGSAEKAESDTGGTVLSNDELSRCIVRLHPHGQISAINVEDSGNGRNDKHVWLYSIGDSSRLFLWKANGSENSYTISFFNGSGTDEAADRRFAVVDDEISAVKRNKGVDCENFQLICNDDSTYYIYCKKYDKYWGLKDSGYDDKNRVKLVSLKDAQKWDMEIVGSSLETEDLGAIKSQYDSFNFTNSEGELVTANNWMSKLPDGMRLSDVCIPGAHDSGTANVSMNHAAQCQQFDYTDMLNAGLRYFDLRIGPDTCIVHNSTTCYYRGEIMNLGDVENMIDQFLNENPGETVILQVKIDRGGYEAQGDAMLEFQKWVKSGRVWCGDHVPTLGECRGKVVIISRFTTPYQIVVGDDGRPHTIKKAIDYTLDGYGQWALDAEYWVDSAEQTTGLVCSGDNYEVWTQDNYGKVGDTKEHYWTNSIFHEAKGAQARRDKAASIGKNAWVISYTSCTIFGQAKYPQEMARDQNPRLISALRKNLATGSRTFLGVICSDFSDEMLAQLVYRHNFAVQHVTVRGVTVDGEEPLLPVTFEMVPGTSGAYLVNRYSEIEAYFSRNGDYQPHDATSIGGMLHRNPMTSYASAQEYAADKLDMSSLPATGDYTLYVALDKPVKYSVSLNLAAPGCTDTVRGVDGNDGSGQTPKPVFQTVKGAHYGVAEVDGDQRAYWVADAEATSALTGSLDVSPKYAYAEIEADFGYCFTSGKASVTYDTGSGTRPLSNCKAKLVDACHIQVIVQADGVSHDLKKIEGTEPTCVGSGMHEHYQCKTCGELFLSTNTSASPVSKDSLLIPATGVHTPGESVVEIAKAATCTEDGGHDEVVRCTVCNEVISSTRVDESALGHDWGEWIVDQKATETADGLRHRVCTRCDKVENEVIPSPGHTHVLVPVAQVDPGCVTQGVAAHYECECGKWFHDEAGKYEAKIGELRIPATGHTGINNITPTREKVVEATCTSKGSYRNVYTCEKCRRPLKVEHVAVEALAHNWGEVTYTWSDDDTAVTATRTCTRDADHPHVETEVAEVAVEVVQPATCEASGRETLTATFKNEAFAAQTKEREVPALGHDWDEGVVTTEPTCTEAGVRTYTCANDATHTRTEDAPATGHVSVAYVDDGTDTATCTQGGVVEVKTHCVVCGEVVKTEQQETDALGHGWSEVTYTWSDDLTQVTASHDCEVCGVHEELSVDVISEVDAEPTCEEAGERTYYAVFPSEMSYAAKDAGLYAFETQEKTAEIPAIGHDWGEWVVTKEPTETEEGEEARTCSRDTSHVETRAIPKLDPSNVTYRVVQGDGAKWAKDSGATLTFVFKRNVNDGEAFSHFVGIRLDGAIVDASNYTAEPGSVVVTLNASYLEGLATGAHTIEALFNDGSSTAAEFTVEPAVEQAAKDGDGGGKAGAGAGPAAADKGALSSTGDSMGALPRLLIATALSAFFVLGAAVRLRRAGRS